MDGATGTSNHASGPLLLPPSLTAPSLAELESGRGFLEQLRLSLALALFSVVVEQFDAGSVATALGDGAWRLAVLRRHRGVRALAEQELDNA
jgi:hypothetical protein